MGEPIRRKTLAAIAREYERDGRVAPWQPDAPKEFNPGAVFFGVNYSQTPIMPGDRIKVESFKPWNISYAVAYKRILKTVSFGAYKRTLLILYKSYGTVTS